MTTSFCDYTNHVRHKVGATHRYLVVIPPSPRYFKGCSTEDPQETLTAGLHLLAVADQSRSLTCTSTASSLRRIGEELDQTTGRHLAHFPQAPTHLSLINAVLQRNRRGAHPPRNAGPVICLVSLANAVESSLGESEVGRQRIWSTWISAASSFS